MQSLNISTLVGTVGTLVNNDMLLFGILSYEGQLRSSVWTIKQLRALIELCYDFGRNLLRLTKQ